MNHHRSGRLVPAFAAALALAAPLHLSGGDGTLEIDQACVATGCFPGDDPGFPVEIAAPGSYVLTSNLRVPDENTGGIEIETDFVVIDLGGGPAAGYAQNTLSGNADGTAGNQVSGAAVQTGGNVCASALCP